MIYINILNARSNWNTFSSVEIKEIIIKTISLHVYLKSWQDQDTFQFVEQNYQSNKKDPIYLGRRSF